MSISILENCIVRVPTTDDLEAIAGLINACDIVDEGVATKTLESMQSRWSTPGFNPETDTYLVTTRDGQAIGYVDVWDTQALHIRPQFWGGVHPAYRGRGIGKHLVHFAVERAKQAIAKAPDGARVSVSTGVNVQNASAQALLQREGFQHIRSSYTMEISLTEIPPTPQWPDGITARTVIPGKEDHAVFEAIEETFSDHWGHVPQSYEQFEHFISKSGWCDQSMWYLAMASETIAGLALCVGKSPEGKESALVDTLGVRRPWRRQGLGLALLHHVFGEIYKRGLSKAVLYVDASNLTGALRLYQRAGMHIVKQYNRYEKELRPGKELSTQAVEG